MLDPNADVFFAWPFVVEQALLRNIKTSYWKRTRNTKTWFEYMHVHTALIFFPPTWFGEERGRKRNNLRLLD